MKKRTILVLLVFAFTIHSAVAQADKRMSFDAFMALVTVHHPMAKQAELRLAAADAYYQKSRGAFDPYAFAGISEKYFQGKQYYSLADGGLKIPTWFGLQVKAGQERADGEFLNPENNLPTSGLWYGGVSAQLGNGLLMDERRANLRQAQIYQESSIAERRYLYNKLMLNAGNAYWEWFMAYNNIKVFENALQLVQVRFNAIKRSAILGDRAFIDTLEAVIQLQNRQLSLLEAQLEYKNATAKLDIFLWADGVVPLEITAETTPPEIDSVAINALDITFLNSLDSLQNTHPLLQQFRFKLLALDIERRLKAEQLKPNLELSYTPLATGGGNPLNALSLNNYKWGVGFSMPLFLRKQRGDLNLIKIETQEMELSLKNKTAEIEYFAISSLNIWETSVSQAELYQKNAIDFERLLIAERTKFDIGESSVFLVNTREIGFINAQIKYIETITKNHKAALKAGYALGLLY